MMNDEQLSVGRYFDNKGEQSFIAHHSLFIVHHSVFRLQQSTRAVQPPAFSGQCG